MPRLFTQAISNSLKNKLLFSLLAMNVIFALVGIATLIVATVVGSLLRKQEKVLSRYYSTKTLPLLFSCCAGGMTLISAFAIFVILTEKVSTKPKTYRSLRLLSTLLFIYMWASLGLSLYIFVTSTVAFAHIVKMENAFGRGMTISMHQYNMLIKIKIVIDNVQRMYKCCGVRNYEDWFKLPWMKNVYEETDEETGKLRNDEIYGENVPFSCCDPSFPTECHNDLVRDNNAHYGYKYEEQMAIYKVGCREVLMNYFGGVLLPGLGGYSVVLVVLQLVASVIARYLNTSLISEAAEEEPIVGWLIQWKSDLRNEEEERSIYGVEDEGEEDDQTPYNPEVRMKDIIVKEKEDIRPESAETACSSDTKELTRIDKMHIPYHRKRYRSKSFVPMSLDDGYQRRRLEHKLSGGHLHQSPGMAHTKEEHEREQGVRRSRRKSRKRIQELEHSSTTPLETEKAESPKREHRRFGLLSNTPKTETIQKSKRQHRRFNLFSDQERTECGVQEPTPPPRKHKKPHRTSSREDRHHHIDSREGHHDEKHDKHHRVKESTSRVRSPNKITSRREDTTAQMNKHHHIKGKGSKRVLPQSSERLYRKKQDQKQVEHTRKTKRDKH